MYANMIVKIDDYEDIAACELVIENGELVITLDDPDHEGSTAEPIGEQRVKLSDLTANRVRITANF